MVMIQPKKEELDSALDAVMVKIDSGVVTCEDFNDLIKKTMIVETTPEAVRDRLRRRTIKNVTDSHVDNETGHQQLNTPTFAARIQPKRKPANQQSHGRSGIAHAHSAKTQRKTMSDSLREAVVPEKFKESLEFLIEHAELPIDDDIIASVPNRFYVKALATKLMSRPGFNRDWLHTLIQKLD